MNGEYISIETARIMADIEKENKMLIEALEINHKIIDKYEERINKAIEYIDQILDFVISEGVEEEKREYRRFEYVKGILQGEDKE